MPSVPCAEINNFNASEQCQFYHDHVSCHDSDGQLDYLYFIFCIFQEKSWMGAAICISLAMWNHLMMFFCIRSIILVVWLLIMFIALGVTADDFLCPSLVVITKTLHLSQNIAGVTFLAFGNGAPDIFSSVAATQQSRPELVIGTLFGAGIFVTSVVAGSIIVSRPFKIMERPFLRDTIFYTCASFWAFIRLYYEEFTLWHSIGFIGLYVVYIVVVIVSRLVYRRSADRKKKEEEANNSVKVATIPTIEVSGLPSSADGETGGRRGPSTSVSMAANPSPEDDNPEAEGIVLRRFSFRGSIPGLNMRSSSVHSQHEQILKSLRLSVDNHFNPLYQNGSVHRPTLDTQISKYSLASLLSNSSGADWTSRFKDFLHHLCPIDFGSWSGRRWISRAMDIIKAPICLLLILTSPVVDYGNDRDNWCRTLNVLHCITCPMFVVYATGSYQSVVPGTAIPVWSVVFSASVVIAFVVYFFTNESEIPGFHWLYAYLGFITSVMWVYLIANEIVSLLKALGIVFRMSDAILGLTVLAWGNSVGDFISNLSVAKQGYPRMGISACYGGPLLNLLLGIGIPYTVIIVKNGKNIQTFSVNSIGLNSYNSLSYVKTLLLEFTTLMRLLYGTLSVILLSTLITLTALRFNARRYLGIYLICCYCFFVTTAVLLETNIL